MLDEEMPPSENRKFLLKMYVREASPWKVVYCEKGKEGLSLRDSEGSCCSGTEYSYVESGKHSPGIFSISSESWLPSSGAKWVEIQGSIPLFFFRESARTEGVKLKMDKEEPVPLVLKDASPEGKDVKVLLRLSHGEALGKDSVVVHLFSDVRVGAPGIELQMNGVPLQEMASGEISRNAGEKHGWSWTFEWNRTVPGDLTAFVKYAVGLKKIMVPVKMRVGLFGMEYSFQPGGLK